MHISKNLKELYEHTFYRKDVEIWYKSVGFTAEVDSGIPGDDPTEKRGDWKFLTPAEALKLDLFEPARKGLSVYIATNNPQHCK